MSQQAMSDSEVLWDDNENHQSISSQDFRRDGRGTHTGHRLNGGAGAAANAAADDATTTGPSDMELLVVRETNQVSWMRTAVLLVLLGVTALVSCAGFFTARRADDRLFQELYYSGAGVLAQNFVTKTNQKVRAVDLLSISITSWSKATHQTWPFVTLHDYHWQGASVNSLAEAVSVYLVPLVPTVQRVEWEAYAQQNVDWVDDGLAFEVLHPPNQNYEVRPATATTTTTTTTTTATAGQKTRRTITTSGEETNNDNNNDDSQVTMSSTILPYIFIVENGETVPVTTTTTTTQPNYYFPLWQSFPVLPELTNFELHSSPQFAGDLEAVLQVKKAVIGQATDIKSSGNMIFQVFQARWQETGGVLGNDPISKMYVPIWSHRPLVGGVSENAQQEQEEEPTIVGVLISVIFWETYFSDILSNDSPPLLVVLKNACGQVYSYEITGPTVNYLGEGDQHDDRWNEFVVSLQPEEKDDSDSDSTSTSTTSTSSIMDGFHKGGIALDKNYCPYSLSVYPTKEFYKAYHSSRPFVLMAVVIVIFGLTTIMFEIYVAMIEKRQRQVMTQAKKSETIVSR
jgi:hypothetical protein